MKLDPKERKVNQEWTWKWSDRDQRGFLIRISQGQVQQHGNYKTRQAASKACSQRNIAMRRRFKKTQPSKEVPQ